MPDLVGLVCPVDFIPAFVFPFDPLRENSDIIAEPEVILSFQLDQTKYEGLHNKIFSSLFDQMLDVLKIK